MCVAMHGSVWDIQGILRNSRISFHRFPFHFAFTCHVTDNPPSEPPLADTGRYRSVILRLVPLIQRNLPLWRPDGVPDPSEHSEPGEALSCKCHEQHGAGVKHTIPSLDHEPRRGPDKEQGLSKKGKPVERCQAEKKYVYYKRPREK